MNNLFIIMGSAFLLVLLLYSEKRGNPKSLLITKSTQSLIFVITAFFQPNQVPQFQHYLLLGLILCLIGDVCLALPGEKMFMMGLGAFFAGHLFYILGFSFLTPFSRWISPGALIAVFMSAIIFFWLRPHLKSMFVPVLLYILVITMMLSGAWAVFAKSSFAVSGRMLVFAGALCFYLSDVFVARDKFIRDEFRNRLIGLPLYYSGQFSLAFSAGFLQ
jgi:uncharacterized membrane protein YhhN